MPKDKHWHVFGAYCLFYINKENRVGTFAPPSEMGIWVGQSPHVPGGSLVCPIEWDSEKQAFIIHEVVDAMTVRVYDTVFPLRMKPRKGKYGSQEFDTFIDRVFNPRLETALEEEQAECKQQREKEKAESTKQNAEGDSSDKLSDTEPEGVEGSEDPDHYEIEKVLNRRVKNGVVQYKVKWKGWNNRYTCWRDEEDLECQELIEEYIQTYGLLSQQDVQKQCLILLTALAAAGSVVGIESDSNRDQALGMTQQEVEESVGRLLRRQQVTGEIHEYVDGYNRELDHMLSRRLRLLEPEEEERVRAVAPIVSLRMLLEAKKDGRRKARLILQGFKEPREWDLNSNVSPVANTSTIRSLVFCGGSSEDVLSSIDVSVAFLQSTEYGEDEPLRYVSYKPYKEAREYVFQLRGPIYGQRSAPRAWYRTISEWMVDCQGFDQGKDEPCVFRHPETGVTVVLFCDDFLCRGSKMETEKFYAKLMGDFECKDPTYLNVDQPIIFTGFRIRQHQVEKAEGSETVYTMDQETDLLEFLAQKGLDAERLRDNPMADRKTLLTTGAVSENMQSWCKSVVGGLHYYARGTRWDISFAVSRIGGCMDPPTAGTVAAIDHVAGYLRQHSSFSLVGKANLGVDEYTVMCDASFCGDSELTSKSQTGVLGCLNGVPIHWRSNRQPKTVMSPTVAEIYALSVGVIDARLMSWILSECGAEAGTAEINIGTDSTGAKSFKEDTCPTSKTRGNFSYREDWVQELKDSGDIKVKKVEARLMIADIMTKCYETYKFKKRVEQIRNLAGDQWRRI